MPDKGPELGVDLYRLLVAGRVNLPTVARVFAQANNAVADTDAGLDAAFTGAANFGGGGYGPVYTPWKQLRDQLQKILGHTSVDVELTGEALCLAASEFAKTDQEAADTLRQQITEKGDPIPRNVPKPRYP